MRLSLAWLGEIAGNLLGKWASSAMDLSSSSKLIDKQLQAQKDLFAYENQNKHCQLTLDLHQQPFQINSIASPLNEKDKIQPKCQ